MFLTRAKMTNKKYSHKKQKADKIISFTVKSDSLTLFDFLFTQISSKSKSGIKSLLSNRQVMVNGKTETQYNFLLTTGDNVFINFSKPKASLKHPKLQLLYEDEYLIVVNKSPGLLAVATERKEESTAFHIVRNYLRKQDPASKLYVVHGIDREASGVLLFAKDKEVQIILQNNWYGKSHERIHHVLVEGQPEKEKDTIVSWLTESIKSRKVYSSLQENGGQRSVTHYQLLKSSGNFSLLEVKPETGKKNQIRVHMQSIGHPVVGDKKYGAQSSLGGCVGLHLSSLSIRHPFTGKLIRFESPLPQKMTQFFDL
jgi:23S rRNA pseudouridine1911/1915/1917 synthase